MSVQGAGINLGNAVLFERAQSLRRPITPFEWFYVSSVVEQASGVVVGVLWGVSMVEGGFGCFRKFACSFMYFFFNLSCLVWSNLFSRNDKVSKKIGKRGNATKTNDISALKAAAFERYCSRVWRLDSPYFIVLAKEIGLIRPVP